MDFFILRIGILLAGCALAAVHDAKTGLIPDKITYSMIAIGIILNLVEFDLPGLAMGAIVFGIGYLVYYFGKIGGGDVKLFTGIAFLLPFFSGKIFVLSALLFSALFAVIFYSIFFVSKYARKGIDWKENKPNIGKSIAFAIIFAAYLLVVSQSQSTPVFLLGFLATGFFCGTIFLAFEKGIRKNFFLKKIKTSELEEDEVIAVEFLDEEAKNALELHAKGILGEKEKEKLEKAGIKQILVYRNMPPFAPFIFLAIITLLALPELAGFLLI